MEQIFREEGLPVELTRLPFVESSFNIRARSKVGASGIWQFMRSTGRHFLRINDAVDERNDPILATEAAAKLLKVNYESLKAWPLAVTAYNHGRQGMMRAVRRVGSDELDDVIGGYRARSFGFASSNFFACLLAAIEVERDAEKYFGKVERDAPLEFYEVRLPDSIRLTDLGKFMSLPIGAVAALNPGLSERVLAGRHAIPAGYRLRMPADGKTGKEQAAKVFLAGYQEIPAKFKKAGTPSSSAPEKVRAKRRKKRFE
jgi:membrane-bound lytic murein transglycosylase D